MQWYYARVLLPAGCDLEPPREQDAVRLRGGFGTPCDPLHSGFVEVFNAGEWGAICDGEFARRRDFLVADVVCRQLGFPHGTVVDSETTRPDLYFDYYFNDDIGEESEVPLGRVWLNAIQCSGPESRLVDCNLGPGFLPAASVEQACFRLGSEAPPSRLYVACRKFAIPEALEAVVAPAAGAP